MSNLFVNVKFKTNKYSEARGETFIYLSFYKIKLKFQILFELKYIKQHSITDNKNSCTNNNVKLVIF